MDPVRKMHLRIYKRSNQSKQPLHNIYLILQLVVKAVKIWAMNIVKRLVIFIQLTRIPSDIVHISQIHITKHHLLMMLIVIPRLVHNPQAKCMFATQEQFL